MLSASAGVAHHGPSDETPADAVEILRRADVARHHAKELGGGRIEADDLAVRARWPTS